MLHTLEATETIAKLVVVGLSGGKTPLFNLLSSLSLGVSTHGSKVDTLAHAFNRSLFGKCSKFLLLKFLVFTLKLSNPLREFLSVPLMEVFLLFKLLLEGADCTSLLLQLEFEAHFSQLALL